MMNSFVTLTAKTGNTLAVHMDDILIICSIDNGSSIKLKSTEDCYLTVCETIDEILEKIAQIGEEQTK
ncbi:MAG: hypothetical protein E7576_07060 [Ruminococcaceae bacterium]|nr:hypothetical protein [Oscillospiraceae bacterium]